MSQSTQLTRAQKWPVRSRWSHLSWNRVFSILTSIFELLSKTSSGIVVGSAIGGREYPWRETSTGHGRNPSRFFILNRKSLSRITRATLQTSFNCCSFYRDRQVSTWPYSCWLVTNTTSKMCCSWCRTRVLEEVLSHAWEHVCSCNCSWTSRTSAPGKWVPSSAWKTSTLCFFGRHSGSRQANSQRFWAVMRLIDRCVYWHSNI